MEFEMPRRSTVVTIRSGSFPPPTVMPVQVAPSPTVSVAPVALRSYRGAASGSRSTVFVGEAPAGTFTFTGEFYPPATLMAFRIGQLLLSVVMVASLVMAMFVNLGRADGADVPALFGVMMVLSFGSMIGLLIWKGVLLHSAGSATLVVRADEIRHVRSTVNYGLLAWWLLDRPVRADPAVRRSSALAAAELPVIVDGAGGRLPLVLLEQHRGDADLLVAVAHGRSSVRAGES
jgi:hypothetical protein